MTGDIRNLSTVSSKKGGCVSFANNKKGRIMGIGNIGNNSSPIIEEILLVDNLKHNLLSISQLCDKGFTVIFRKNNCLIIKDDNLNVDSANIAYSASRYNDIYKLHITNNLRCEESCLLASNDELVLWHKRLGHVNLKNLMKLSKNSLVEGLPKFSKTDFSCDSCSKGKMIKSSFKSINDISTSSPLELLHMDLFGPSRTLSLGGKRYVFVIIDDFSRFTWVIFLRHKSDCFTEFAKFCKLIQKQTSKSIIRIRSDHGGEFENESFSEFCDNLGIFHEFSFPRAPSQNGVVERKNRTLQEMARTMLCDKDLPKHFWAEAVNTACYTCNRIYLRPILEKTPYELFYDSTPKVKYFRIFGSKCFILNTKESLDKFDTKADEGIFMGYSLRSKAYRIYNKNTRTIEESLHVKFNESSIQLDNVDEESVPDTINDSFENEKHLEVSRDHQVKFRHASFHPKEQIIGSPTAPVHTRSYFKSLKCDVNFVSSVEPKNIHEACLDEYWILAMQEELNQFKRQDVWELVAPPEDHTIIGTKWIFRNKLDSKGNVVRNKARLVAQGYRQEEGIDYDETFAPVARLESIRLLLAYACFMNIKLFQMDVKSAFLNGYLKEEVYVKQPPNFEDSKFPNHVFKLNKALYGLKQAPRAWYDRLKTFLLKLGFIVGSIDPTLFMYRTDSELLVIQIYVDDIIFGSTNETLCKEFSEKMKQEFEMSMMGELNYFLGLEINQISNGIFIHQSKYTKELLKKFEFESVKEKTTPMSTTTSLDRDDAGKDFNEKKYRGMIGSLLYLTASRPDILFPTCLCARFQSRPKESHAKAVKRIFAYLKGTQNMGIYYSNQSSFNLSAYTDADFGGSRIDRKSTSGSCYFLGHSIISWFSKKQNIVALSTTEAEYIAAGFCGAQVLWLLQSLRDFGYNYNKIPIFCDNTSTINLSKNPILHSRTKHIDIKHHFLRDHIEKHDFELLHVSTKEQLADIFTKPLPLDQFVFIRRELGICSLSSISMS